MIYLDSSVLLASVFGEPRSPPADFWNQELTSSRLLVYEVWTRLHAYRLATSHGDIARARLERVNFVALGEGALARALEPFPVALRTLDALHLSTMVFLGRHSQPIELASYDSRLVAASGALGFPLAPL